MSANVFAEPRPRVLVLDSIHTAGIECLKSVAEVDLHTGAALSEAELCARITPYQAVVTDAAEMTIALIFAVARRIAEADQMLKCGQWEPSALVGAGITGKTLGIVGLGRVGRQVARPALAFGMRVIVNQTRATTELAEEWRVEQVNLRELLAELFVHPQFSPDIVLQVAARGRLLPAGITRFMIPGRILRLNAPLDILAAGTSLSTKADWLDRLVEVKVANRGVRYHEEPVMLLDE